MAGGLSIQPVGAPLTLLLVQIVVILVLVRFLGMLLSKIKQPIVIGIRHFHPRLMIQIVIAGEIIAGIILGPSVLGYIPGFSNWLFPTQSLGTIALFAQIGLVIRLSARFSFLT